LLLKQKWVEDQLDATDIAKTRLSLSLDTIEVSLTPNLKFMTPVKKKPLPESSLAPSTLFQMKSN
jgi:hypothetical protein